MEIFGQINRIKQSDLVEITSIKFIFETKLLSNKKVSTKILFELVKRKTIEIKVNKLKEKLTFR